MKGRIKRNIYMELSFELKREGRKYSALCLFCEHTLSNISSRRLQSHRNICGPKARRKRTEERESVDFLTAANKNIDKSNDSITFSHDSLTETVIDLGTIMDVSLSSEDSMQEIDKVPTENMPPMLISTLATSTSEEISPTVTQESTLHCETSSTVPAELEVFKIPESPCGTSTKKQKDKCTNYQKNSPLKPCVDILSAKKEEEITELLSRFFYGCNIPFSVVESDHFRNFVKKLRPAYQDKIPSREALSTTLLENEYKKQIEKGKNLSTPDSVLLIGGWQNTASGSKNVITMLHNSTGEQIFLNAWSLSSECKTSERLTEIVEASIGLSKELYDTTVYALVSDYTCAMTGMSSTTNIWHTTCSIHTANLLANDILDKELSSTVVTVLKEFRHQDLENSIFAKGGTEIKLPNETRWSSYIDSFQCLIDNLNYMKQIVADPKYNQIRPNIKQIIFDDNFIENVKAHIKILDPIAKIINESQKPNSSIADAANLWLSLEPPENFQHNEIAYRSRKSMVLNIYALTAYYLHPFYLNEKLSVKQLDRVNDFLLHVLDGEGLAEWDLYNRRQGHFQLLYSKKLSDAYLFWRMASLKHPNLADLAIKLLNIPASSAQIERVFSNWSYAHSDTKNQLTCDHAKKLIHIYHSLRISDSNKSEEY